MKSLLSMLSCVFSLNCWSTLCENPVIEQAGVLDTSIINEASGLAVSRFADRLYHINDSGDGPFFYQTDLKGGNTKKISVDGFVPVDVEDLAYGSCGKGQCLYIGDIGDNPSQRADIKIVIIEEQKDFALSVKPKSILTVKYPDGAHNAEGMAVHPNGDLFILTKEVDEVNHRAAPAKLYRLSKEKLHSGKEQVMEAWGVLDLPYHLYNYNLWGRIVTGLDISKDGQKLLILTYYVAVEMDLNLANGATRSMRTMKEGEDFTLVELKHLPQIESISYLPGDTSFLYNTEFKQNVSEFYKVTCGGPKPQKRNRSKL
jgi:hypothetical protein